MFNKTTSLIAASVLSLSAASFAARNGEDFRSDYSENTPVELLQSGNLESRGKLKGFDLPEYDGPVKWGGNSKVLNVALASAAGFAIGVAADSIISSCSYDYRYQNKLRTAAVLGTTIAGGLIAGSLSPSKVEFETTVDAVVQSYAPHYEKRVRSTGKSVMVVNEGPFYAQTIKIPESDLILTTNPKDAPFIAGQKINATFYFNSKDGAKQIQSWTATAAER